MAGCGLAVVVSSGCVRSRQDHVFAESYEFEYEYGYCTVATAASSTVLARYISTVLYSRGYDLVGISSKDCQILPTIPYLATGTAPTRALTWRQQYRTVPAGTVQYRTVCCRR